MTQYQCASNHLPRGLLLAAFALLATILPVLALASQAFTPGELNPQLDSLFTAGNFEEVELHALRLLADVDTTPRQRAGAYIFLGFVSELSGETEKARDAFFRALGLMPDLRLDRIYVPPALFQSFEEARADVHNLRSQERLQLQETLEVRPRRHTLGTVTNVLIPGSGFYLTGVKELRGYFWTAVNGAALGGLLLVLDKTHEKRDAYLRENNASRFDDRYDEYNRWYKRSILVGSALALAYVSAQIDYQLSSGRVFTRPAVLGDLRSPAPGFSVTVRF